MVAIFATLFGSATSLGLGALQITGGLDNVFGRGGGSKAVGRMDDLLLGLVDVLTVRDPRPWTAPRLPDVTCAADGR